MTMTVIEEEPYFYTLAADGKTYLLDVVCGRSETFMVTVQLTEAEKDECIADKFFARVLAGRVADDPDRYKQRFVRR